MCDPCPHAQKVALEIQHHIHIPGKKKEELLEHKQQKEFPKISSQKLLLRTHWLGLYPMVTPSATGT